MGAWKPFRASIDDDQLVHVNNKLRICPTSNAFNPTQSINHPTLPPFPAISTAIATQMDVLVPPPNTVQVQFTHLTPLSQIHPYKNSLNTFLQVSINSPLLELMHAADLTPLSQIHPHKHSLNTFLQVSINSPLLELMHAAESSRECTPHPFKLIAHVGGTETQMIWN
jgi:uncharacterized protein YhhL (DUF1145 family)